MNTNHLEEDAAKLADKIERTTAAHIESARVAADKLRVKSEVVLDETRNKVCENPMSCIVGAAVFGFALGCLVMCGKRSQTPPQRLMDRSLDQANDVVSRVADRISNVASNLKTW